MNDDFASASFEALGDDALLVRLDDGIDIATNARVHAFVRRIRAHAPDWLRDIVPAYASLGIFFDETVISANEVEAWLCALPSDSARQATDVNSSRIVEIPVMYGGESGPDLDSAATELGISAEEFVRRHAHGDYTVAMIGFAPGFPYLLGLDPALALPRLATPRTQVPAGSVGIGGAQTGIYPRPSPGGWRLIGRTPLSLFDANNEYPTRLQPGDRVRFVAIDHA